MSDSVSQLDELQNNNASDHDQTPTQSNEDTNNDATLIEAYSQVFTRPTSLEASADGKWLAWLQPNDAGETGLWLCSTDEGAEPINLELDFVPVEDRDPQSGRLLRGPQFSPDSSSIALTGTHPHGDRTAIWIVPLAGVIPGGADETPVDEAEVGDTPASETVESASEATVTLATEAELEFKEHQAEIVEESPGIATAEYEGMVAMPPPVEEVDTNRPFLLVDHHYADRSPRWSPDGVLIAFTSTVDGRDVIALGSPKEPGDMEMLTWGRNHSREPQWSRDGRFLAFLRPIDGGEEYHDIWSFSLEAGVLTNLTGEKSPAVRHSIEWVPGRSLIAFVTVESDWLAISVVNADNKAGWVVTRESGDKTEPRFAPDEARLVYLRTEGFTTVLCERSLHSSASIALDPGEGVVSMGRWCGPKRVVYGFSAPQQPFNMFLQENVAKAERAIVSIQAQGSIRDMNLLQPQPLEFQVGEDETFSGLMYRPEGATRGVIYLPDGPLTTRRGEFQPEEQALATHGAAVLSPVLHGATGFGVAIENDLREFASTELETNDIAEAARELGRQDHIDSDKIAVVGHGLGGTLALVAAGARPGSFGAVVAIDPIVDWTTELATTNVRWRQWITDRFGMPLTDADVYALRTPATFSAVIACPVILIRTAHISHGRALQFEMLKADLDSVNVPYTVLDVPEEPYAATLVRVGRELSALFGDDVAVVAEESNSADV